MSDLLVGKTAIVTGSSRGIGRAIALEFARQGADLVVNYAQRRDDAEHVAAEIEALGRRAVVVQASVEQGADVERLFARAREAYGRIDILVNNAGIVRDGLLAMMSEDAWRSVLKTNLDSVYHCSRAAVRLMIRQGHGQIVNVASLSGVSGRRGQCNYAASKGAMIAFTKSLAQECGQFNIRVNAIAPGLILTELLDDVSEAMLDDKVIPLQRLGHPEEVASVAVFLASDMGSYMTGAVVNVNGGMYM